MESALKLILRKSVLKFKRKTGRVTLKGNMFLSGK
jgi:hypothetical protein